MEELIEAKGYNGHVSFDGTFVTITRKGLLGRTSIGKGEKRIPIGSISAVQWKSPGLMVNGFISFSLAGANEKQSGFGSQTFDAVKDENSVIVRKGKEAPFVALRLAIEEAIARRHAPPPTAMSASVADELMKLKELYDAGVLTEEQFESQKDKLLG